MPTKPPDILDRERAWNELTAIFQRPRPELCFVLGRRRVGKSFVLSRFARAVGGIYYQATRRTEHEQLANISKLLGEHFGDDSLAAGATLPSWEALFAYLVRRAGDAPTLIVLDEFPYLTASAPALTSIIQSVWDHELGSTRVKLVLSGSFISAMTALEQADQPLFGRRTAKMMITPFRVHYVAKFVPAYTPRDQLRVFATVGHLPGQLALLDPDVPLATNIAQLLLRSTGRLVDDAQHMLDAFVADAEVHYSIIEAIANGAQTWSGLTSRVARTGGSLTRPLKWLEEMQIVAREVPVTVRRPSRSKRAIYRIQDPYVAFWHRAIAPLINNGAIGLADPDVLYAEVVEPRLDEHMGAVFEHVCRDWVAHTDRLGFRPLQVGSWWDKGSAHQVDVVAIGTAGELLVGECKWGGVTGGDLEKLRERSLEILAELNSAVEPEMVLFTGSGEFDGHVRRAVATGRVRVFTLEDVIAAS